jgi:hypothetical protein
MLQSKPRTGTTAEPWLPVVEAGAAAPGLERKKASSTATVPEKIHLLCVLGIEEDPLVLEYDAGGRATPTARPFRQEGLGTLADRTIDFIVTDQAMPQMTDF